MSQRDASVLPIRFVRKRQRERGEKKRRRKNIKCVGDVKFLVVFGSYEGDMWNMGKTWIRTRKKNFCEKNENQVKFIGKNIGR